mgnify:CR=1 FL=1
MVRYKYTTWGGGRKEYIYHRGSYTKIGQDYGGSGTGAENITDTPLPFVRHYMGGRPTGYE